MSSALIAAAGAEARILDAAGLPVLPGSDGVALQSQRYFQTVSGCCRIPGQIDHALQWNQMPR